MIVRSYTEKDFLKNSVWCHIDEHDAFYLFFHMSCFNVEIHGKTTFENIHVGGVYCVCFICILGIVLFSLQ